MASDCDEYPCIAFYAAPAGDASSNAALEAVLREQHGDDAAVFVSALRDDAVAGGTTWTAVAVTPAGDDATRRAVKTRLDARAEPHLDNLRDAATDRPAP